MDREEAESMPLLIRHAAWRTTVQKHDAAMNSLRATRAAATLRRLAADEPVDQTDRDALKENRELLQAVLDALPFDPIASQYFPKSSGLRQIVSTEVIASAVPNGVDVGTEELARYLRGVVEALAILEAGRALDSETEELPTVLDLRDFFERLSESARRRASVPPEVVVRD